MRTARVRTSGENLFVVLLVMAPSSQELEPPANPGRFIFDSLGFVCDDDIAAIIRATVLAIGVSLDKPEDDPERRIAIISDDGRKIGTVPVYSRPSYKNPAQ